MRTVTRGDALRRPRAGRPTRWEATRRGAETSIGLAEGVMACGGARGDGGPEPRSTRPATLRRDKLGVGVAACAGARAGAGPGLRPALPVTKRRAELGSSLAERGDGRPDVVSRRKPAPPEGGWIC